MDLQERIRQHMLAKQKKAQEKERDALKRTTAIIAELQESGGQWSLTNFDEVMSSVVFQSLKKLNVFFLVDFQLVWCHSTNK